MTNRIRRIIIFAILCISLNACGPLSSTTIPEPTNSPQSTLSFQKTQTPELLPTASPEIIQSSPAASEALDHVTIYLVAVGDNGISGKLIGCGDSLVPVEISIEPTLGVLRAAITELLKLEGQSQYGQSGLYNALSLSSLTLEDVYIVNGKAVIEFTGSLIYGGECDIPRIEEQLTALALQFSTVDSVAIFVNGEPLEKLLDLRG